MANFRPRLIDCESIEPLRKLYFGLGLSLCDQGHHEEAIGELEKAWDQAGAEPENWQIRYLMGEAHQAMGNQVEALRAFLEATAEAPQRADELLPYAQDLLTRSIAIAEAEWLEQRWDNRIQYEDLDPDDQAEVAFFRGRVNFYTGNYSPARKWFKRAAGLRDDDPRILEGLGASLQKEGKLDAARDALTRARELASQGIHAERMPTIGGRLVRVLIQEGEYESALELAIESQEEGGRFSHELLLAQGLSYLALGQAEQALKIAAQLREAEEADVNAAILHAQALIAKHRYGDAISDIDEALQYEPGNPELAFHKIQALIEGDTDLDQAKRMLQRFVKRRGIGELSARLESPFMAVRAGDGNACYFGARAHYELYPNWTLKQALEEAERAFDQGFTDTDGSPEAAAWLLKGEILERKRHRAAAGEAYYEAGRRYGWRNEYQRAVELLAHARALDPEHVPACWYLSDHMRILAYQTDGKEEQRKGLEEALGIWQQGDELQRADRDAVHSTTHSWALILRAFLSEGLASLQAKEPVDLPAYWWEALVFLERALLLNQYDAHRWAYLGRYYRSVSLGSNAEAALNQALGLNESNLAACEEKLILLVNTGRFSEAREFVQDWPSSEDAIYDEWLSLMEAYVLTQSGEYRPALEMSGGDEPESRALWLERQWYWVHNMRAQCYAMLEDPDRALQEHLYTWKDFQDDSPGELASCGAAAFHIAMLKPDQKDLLQAAIDLAKRAAGNPAQAMEAHSILGLCYLAAEETLERARAEFVEAIGSAKNARELNELVCLDLKIVRTYAAKWQHRAAAEQILERAEAMAKEKIEKLEQQTPSAEAELRDQIERIEGTDGSAWWAATAGLARLYAEREQWREAAVAYQRLLEESRQSTAIPAPFPEARLGLERAVDTLRAESSRQLDKHNPQGAIERLEQALAFEGTLSRPGTYAEMQQELGHAYLQAGEPEEALGFYTQALDQETVAADKELQAALYGWIGYVHFATADLGKARLCFAKALSLSSEAGVADPGKALGTICWPLLQDIHQYWGLDSEWQAFAADPQTGAQLRLDLAAARRSLSAYLGEYFQLGESTGSVYEMLPVVTPIAVELGRDLLPEDTGGDWPILKVQIPDMRERLKQEMGVEVPGVRVRGNEVDPPFDGYTIMLDEVPVAKGALKQGHVYCAERQFTLQWSYDIPGTALSPADHPVTGEPGCWVHRDYQSVLAEHGVEVWQDHELYLIHHIEAILRQNLATFVGAQETANLLERWSSEDDGSELVAQTLPDTAARLRFGRVLRALLAEGVSIAPWRKILEAVRGVGLPREDVHEAVRAARLHLKEHLPGNRDEYERATRAHVPESFELGVSKGISWQGGTPFLEIRPEETKELMTNIRNSLYYEQDAVIIASDATVRPLVHQLVALEFPRVHVIAEEELLSPDEETV